MYVAGDGHFNLEPQSHVTPKTAPILEVKVLLGLVVQGAVSCQRLEWGREWGWEATGRGDGPEQGGGSGQTVEGQIRPLLQAGVRASVLVLLTLGWGRGEHRES